MTAVPKCGRVGCERLAAHTHDTWGSGDVVVVEPKRPSAPGWVYATPRGTVTSPRPYVDHAREVVDVQLDGGPTHAVPLDLLTRWHTWRRRKPPEPGPKLLPRLPRTHIVADPDVEQPGLFEAS